MIFKNYRGKLVSLGLIACMVLVSPITTSSVSEALVSPQMSGLIQVYLKPDVSIVVNGQEKIFRDVNNKVVYPIIYNGSTYLPVRAISALMQEDIEWDSYSKTVFIGKTFSNPNKIKHMVATGSAVNADDVFLLKAKPEMIAAYLRENFLIMVDFQLQTFNDEQGKQVFPMVVNGSTYLPIRAVSELMKQTIDWDGINKVITIGSPTVPVPEKSEATKAILSQFEKQIQLYDSATVKIKTIQKAGNPEELLLIATEVSKDYAIAAANTVAVKAVKTQGYKENELAAHASLVEFTEISEHYILVLENIAYMAAAEQDYSMLAETFLTFAMDSQAKLDQTRVLVDTL